MGTYGIIRSMQYDVEGNHRWHQMFGERKETEKSEDLP